jgi:glutamyl-tRNA reductase
LDATLVIIGLDFHTSPVAVRERFWIPDDEKVGALHALTRSEGIDEVIVLATCGRTEFVLWASAPTEGANSVLRFLTRKFDLKLSDWSNFYRLVDSTALLHLFRIVNGVDSMAPGDPEIAAHVRRAWQLSQDAGTSGRFLDATMQKALSLAAHLRAGSAGAKSAVSVPHACVDFSSEVFGSLAEKSVLLLGAGKAARLAAGYYRIEGTQNFAVLGRTKEGSEILAAQLGGRAVGASQLRSELSSADIVIAATSSPTFVLTRNDLAIGLKSRRRRLPIVLIDLGLPRNIDPEVRGLPGVFLFDLDDVERALERKIENRAAITEIEKTLAAEVQGFCAHLLSEQDVPTVVALRHRLEEICGQELRSLEDQFGPFTEDQQHALHSLASHITQRIAGGVARKLKELPELADQEQLTEAMQRLFHLQAPQRVSSAQSPCIKE